MERVLANTAAAGSADYVARRAWIAEYFDRTASVAWAQLTSDAPVSAVRRSVRAARERMRNTLASWLPRDLSGRRILDAGCGTGTLAMELAARGAQVVAIDLAPSLVQLAADRTPAELRERIDFRAGDMFDATLGTFDHIVAMDSIIHYRAPEMLSVVNGFRSRATRSVLFTVVPRTPLLMVMHTLGRAFPRSERAPAIEPISKVVLTQGLKAFEPHGWYLQQSLRVSGGFYTSQAVELRHEETAQ
jgi:magnesium-protoporphyrin O-methyltransferase